jgi:peptidoglycan hydrolase-like protein with peptidoglycan-binding domain
MSGREPSRRSGALPVVPWRAPALVRLACLGTVTTALLSGCAEDTTPQDPVGRAEEQVAQAQQAVEQAEAELDRSAVAFCDVSRDYITGIDRYGDILTATAPTVGDVRDAGGELVAPRDETLGSAEAAVRAHEDVVAAEQQLAEAEAALEEARNPSGATGSTGAGESGADASESVPPLVPAASVSRVTQAEAELDAALEGVTDETPLRQASEQANAAAVALELSWLRLFADAGCLTDEQQVQAQAAVAEYTTALQKSLAEAGYYEAEVDGLYGPATVEAVRALQEAHDLPETGTVDRATDAALGSELQELGGAAADQELASTAAVQQTLMLAGYWDGPVDGRWTDALTKALSDLQEDLGVKPTGEVDAATVAALEKAIAELGAAQTPTRSPSPTDEADDTEETGESATESPEP